MDPCEQLFPDCVEEEEEEEEGVVDSDWSFYKVECAGSTSVQSKGIEL